MESFLMLGFLVGMGHAFEADHLAAVGALASEGRATGRRLALLGASWGLGHTTTLFLISTPVVAFGYVLTARMAAGMEFFVGLMLVGLGGWVLWKMWRRRIHFHLHDHGCGPHFHAHSHAGSHLPHARDPHEHDHPAFSLRAYLVGLAHGAAGSAGLVALAAAATGSAWLAAGYILVFGLGSVLGMATLSWVASWPLRLAETATSRLLAAIRLGVAGLAILLGVAVIAETGPLALFGAG